MNTTPPFLQTTNSPSREPSPGLLTKQELAFALNLPSTRMVDEMMRKGRIPFLRMGHRTVRFNMKRVLDALSRLEVRAVGEGPVDQRPTVNSTVRASPHAVIENFASGLPTSKNKRDR